MTTTTCVHCCFPDGEKNDTVKKGEPAHFFCCVFLFSIVFICGYTFTISDFTHALIIASFASEHHVQNFCSMKDMVTPKNTFRSHPKKSVAWVAPSCSKPLLFCSLLFRQYSFYLSFLLFLSHGAGFLFFLIQVPLVSLTREDKFLRFMFSVE